MTTIEHQGKSFVGRVKSASAKCRKGRIIILRKDRKSGQDKNVGSDVTSRSGEYSISKKNARGTYYSLALKKTYTTHAGQRVTCSKDRSPREKVRGDD